MTWKKGESGNTKGRPEGAVQKDKAKVRAAIRKLLEYGAPQMIEWLQEIEKPEERFRVLTGLLEFDIPKLARTEVKTEHSGEMKITRPKRPDES